MSEYLCRRYPAYTPETALAAPSWVWRNAQMADIYRAALPEVN